MDWIIIHGTKTTHNIIDPVSLLHTPVNARYILNNTAISIMRKNKVKQTWGSPGLRSFYYHVNV